MKNNKTADQKHLSVNFLKRKKASLWNNLIDNKNLNDNKNNEKNI